MNNILESILSPSNELIVIFLLMIAVFRVYLEVIGVNLSELPVSQHLAKWQGRDNLKTFHKRGLYFSIGYILFFAPPILLG